MVVELKRMLLSLKFQLKENYLQSIPHSYTCTLTQSVLSVIHKHFHEYCKKLFYIPPHVLLDYIPLSIHNPEDD